MVGAKPRVQLSPCSTNGSSGIWAWMLPELAPEAAAVDLAALDQEDVGSAEGEIIGDRRTGEPAADDQDVGPRHTGVSVCRHRPRQPIVPAVRGEEIPGHGTAVPRQLHRHDHTLHRGRQGDRPPAWRRFVDWQLAEGVPGIIILGTTGEFLT